MSTAERTFPGKVLPEERNTASGKGNLKEKLHFTLSLLKKNFALRQPLEAMTIHPSELSSLDRMFLNMAIHEISKPENRGKFIVPFTFERHQKGNGESV